MISLNLPELTEFVLRLEQWLFKEESGCPENPGFGLTNPFGFFTVNFLEFGIIDLMGCPIEN